MIYISMKLRYPIERDRPKKQAKKNRFLALNRRVYELNQFNNFIIINREYSFTKEQYFKFVINKNGRIYTDQTSTCVMEIITYKI